MQSTRSVAEYLRIGSTALAVVVPLYLLSLILRSSVFSRNDYFEMVPTIVDADGSVIWSGLLDHQNEHLMIFPKLAYLANIWAFAGSNVTLGVFVWLVAGGVAAVLAVALRPHLQTGGWNLPILVWLFAVYLFPLQAQHNFRLSMSGTAWILANLFAVAAIALAARDHPVSAAAAGGLATLTYGTGIAVWPAVGLIMLIRRRFGRGELVIVGVAVATIALQRLTAQPGRSSFYEWSPIAIARSMAITLGSLFVSDAELALLIGLGLVALAAAAVVRLGKRIDGVDALILLATMTYVLAGLALFGISRSVLGDDAFTANRYRAFAALFVLALSLLALQAFKWSASARVFVVTAAVASTMYGSTEIERFDAMVQHDDLAMVAVFMDAGVGVVPLYSAATDAAFRAVDHIPFDGSFDLDCGRYGEHIDASDVTTGTGPIGAVEARTIPSSTSFLRPVEVDEIPAFRVTGWIVPDGDVECIVMVDTTGRVTGIALASPPAPVDDVRPSGAREWTGYLERDSPVGDVLVKLRGDDRFHVIGALPEE